jgi:hypothetical protein
MSPRALLLASIIVCGPSVAAAVTVEEIVALSKAGLPDEVLTALIDADRTMFGLSAEQIISLKDAGVSSAVLLKMLASRREFEPPPPGATAGTETSTAQEVSRSHLLIVGSHPQLPRSQPAAAVTVPYYYVPFTPYTIGAGGHRRSRHVTSRGGAPSAGFGRFINDGARRFINTGIPEPHVSWGFPQPAPRRRR